MRKSEHELSENESPLTDPSNNKSTDSNQLAERTANSENAGFVRLYVANQRRVHAFIRTLVFDPADADDVLQETSITGMSKFQSFVGQHSDLSAPNVANEFVSWICTIGKYESLKFYRTHRRESLVLDETLCAELADRQISRLSELESRHEALQSCLTKLSVRDRQLLQGRYELNLSGSELAKRFDRSTNTIYKSLWRIRRSLLSCIDRNLQCGDNYHE